nr:MAG: putative capsid protein [Partitiviridae sp.]
MSSNTLASRLSSLKAKTAELTVQEVKVPDTAADVLTLFQSNSAARSDSANEWIIDVFPNMVNILLYVMLMSIQHATLTDHREHAKSSIATICMYHMSIVYGFFLLNDMYVRPTPSAYARSWHQTSWKHDFAKFLLSLPLPEFLVPVLSQFHACETERTKNVFFIPSAAGFDHNVFFGRFFPLNMFAAIHDCTATMPGNSTRMAVLHDLFSRVLYSITAPAFSCLIPDLLGIAIDQADPVHANYVNSKLYQIFTSVFNPVLFRDFQRRSTLSTLSLLAPVFPTPNVNAYDVLFSASAHNLREIKVVLQANAAILSAHVSCKQNLGTFIVSASGSQILKHGYSTYALPTWSHSENANKAALYAAITHLDNRSEENRAIDFSFLQRPAALPPANTPVTDVIYATNAAPNVPVALPAGHRLTRYWPWSLRYRVTPPDQHFPLVGNESLIKFEDPTDVTPRVLVLDTDGDKTVTAHLPTLCGKIVESFEVDGTTIEQPDARKSLGLQNSMFADSAIPYSRVIPGSEFHPRQANTIPTPLRRAQPNPRPRLPASSLLFDRTVMMLPHINENVIDPALPDTLPGMTEVPRVSWLRYAQSFLGFRTVDGSNNDPALDSIPGMPENRLLIWSCYSYTPFESSDEPLPDLAQSRHYFLINLRTVFGTDFNLVEVKHPFEAMPII